MTAPDPGAPPPHSARQLLRSTLIAIAVAALILVTVVLPAEYGVDPTRVGQVLGLTEMGKIKRQLAAEAAAADSVEASGGETAAPASRDSVPAPALPAAASAPGERADTTVVVMAPTEAREVKLVMNKDARVSFAWTTDRGVVNYDTHGDRPGVRYHGYAKGQGVQADSGSLTAAFDGQHGWFWRNRSRDTVRVTLRTRGAYERVVHVQ
jgi:hypothetical protein